MGEEEVVAGGQRRGGRQHNISLRARRQRVLDDGRRRERLASADCSEGDTVSVARNEKEGERRRRLGGGGRRGRQRLRDQYGEHTADRQVQLEDRRPLVA